MTQNELDPETIAAFLDGRLDALQRERVLVILARSPGAYDLFVEAIRARDALEPEETPASADRDADGAPATTRSGEGSEEPASAGRKSVPGWVPLATAAVLAVVIGVGVLKGPGSFQAGVEDLDPTALAEGVPSGWEAQPWSVVRGTSTGRLTAASVAFRMGVRAVDLEVALALDQPDVALYLATELESLAGEVEVGPPLELRYRMVAGAIAQGEGSEEARAATADLTEYLDAERVRLGRWAELGRIAALTGDRDYLAALRGMPSVPEPSELTPEAIEAVAALEELLARNVDAPDLPAAASAFEALIRAFGG